MFVLLLNFQVPCYPSLVPRWLRILERRRQSLRETGSACSWRWGWRGVSLIAMQVTQKLLEAETKKLRTLESEFSKSSSEQSASMLSLRQLAQRSLLHAYLTM